MPTDTIRKDLLFAWLPIYNLCNFNRGEVISGYVPASCELKPGDCIEYQAGQGVNSFARVIKVGDKKHMMPSLYFEDEILIPGVICTFERITCIP